MGVGGHTQLTGCVPGDRPQRQHPDALRAGVVLDQLRVGEGEYLGGDVIHAQHGRNAQLAVGEGPAVPAVELGQLGVGGLRGVNGVRAHGFCVRAGRRCGGLAVVHRHHVDPGQGHACLERRFDDFDTVGGQTAGQDRQGVPDLNLRPCLLEDLQGLAVQGDGFLVGDGGALDVEVEVSDAIGVDHSDVGVGQLGGGHPARGAPLRQRGSGRSAQRDHHVPAGVLQGLDRPVDRSGLIIVSAGFERVESRPGQLAVRCGLHERCSEQRSAAVGLADREQVGHRPATHVDVGGVEGPAPPV